MILRILIVLVAVLLLVRLVGRWFRIDTPRREAPRVEVASKCPDCGAYVLGSAPGPCARAECRYR
jgi:hypothetical protein